MLRYATLILICLLPLGAVFGQSVLEKRLDFDSEGRNQAETLNLLAEVAGVDIAYSANFFNPNNPIRIHLKDAPLGIILEQILNTKDLGYKLRGDKVVIFRQKPEPFTLSGYLIDSESGEALVSAAVYCPALNVGVLTNEYGFFSLELEKGQWRIYLSRPGYKRMEMLHTIYEDQSIQFSLDPNPAFDGLVIQSEGSESSVQTASPSSILEIDQKLISAIPPLAGEEDLVRAAHLLPGVMAGADGTAGMLVRGGESGQNLMLLDGVPVYIPFHLAGMYSIYNSSSVKSAKLLKGNFSARYGGRLSSILDVRTREGANDKFHAEASANLVNGRLLMEAPVANKRGSMLLTGRLAPGAPLFRTFFNRTYFQVEGGEMETNFSDLLLKLNYQLSQKDRLYATFFTSSDKFGKEYEQQFGSGKEDLESEMYWQNLTGVLRWNHLYSNKLFSNTTLTFSRFSYKFSALERFTRTDSLNPDEIYYVDNRSNNHEYGLQSDYDFFPSEGQHIRFGAGISLRQFSPNLKYYDQNSSELDSLTTVNLANLESLSENNPQSALEGFVYLEDRLRIGSRMLVNAGLRGSGFSQESYTHFRAEPRLSIRYRPVAPLTLFAAGSRMVQYLHLISNTAIRFPNDLWLPSSEGLQPSTSWQAEAGADLHLSPAFDLSLNGYYKILQNLQAVPDGFDFLDSINLESPGTFLRQGSGLAYGLEANLSYRNPGQQGQVSYVLGWSERTFAGQNLGMPFPQDYDRRHQFKFFFEQQIGNRIKAGASWIYLSPGPSLYLVDVQRGLGLTNHQFYAPGEKNQIRSTSYHRLDLSLSYEVAGDRFLHRFRVGAFNVYNRQNVAFYRRDIASVFTNPVFSLPITPSASYLVRF